MTLVKFKPNTDLHRLENSMNHLFSNVFGGYHACDGEDCNWTPAVDINETESEIAITADIPGMKKEDIKVVVHENTLTLKGERTSEKKDENTKYYRFERQTGSFYRSFKLPAVVNSEKIKANYVNGVLEIVLPKVEEAKPKEIAIGVN